MEGTAIRQRLCHASFGLPSPRRRRRRIRRPDVTTFRETYARDICDGHGNAAFEDCPRRDEHYALVDERLGGTIREWEDEDGIWTLYFRPAAIDGGREPDDALERYWHQRERDRAQQREGAGEHEHGPLSWVDEAWKCDVCGESPVVIG